MATIGTSKLNALYTRLPPGMPLTSDDLAALGISADLAVHYVRAGWLTRLARGVFCRPNDTLALHPSLILLQRRLKGLHVGGKSALDWYGVRQYVAQQPVLAERLRRLRSHGMTRDPQQMSEPSHGPWYYQQIELGFNYRITDLQAALGLSQLSKLDDFIARRRDLAARYDRLLAYLPVTLPSSQPEAQSAWHLYVIRLQTDRIGLSHRQVFEGLRAAGVGVNLHYIPVHLQPYYRDLGFAEGDFPEAERYYAEAISLPLFPLLSDEQQDYVVEQLRRLTE